MVSQAAAALVSGKIDMLAPVPIRDVERLRTLEGIRTFEGMDTRVIILGFGHGKETLDGTGAPNPFQDAVAYVPLCVEPLVWAARDGIDLVQRPDNFFMLRWVTAE